MIFLLDTNAFSDLMRRNSKTRTRLGNIPSTDKVVICPIIRGEIRYGIERLPTGKKRTELEASATEVFGIVSCELLDEAVGDHYAALKIELQRKGAVLVENDIWIAATALALGAVLVTRDRDFQNVDGLTVED